jgi:glycosyltransferase involved in cell wall biosynthesis
MAKVSVIVPCFNHARFLHEALNSILGQTYNDIELIIVDDCSTDNSWQIIEKFIGRDSRVKGLRHEHNKGLSTSRNDGLRIANGDFIGFCDSDDVWEPDKLKIQVDFLQKHPDYGIIYSDSTIIDESGAPTGKCFSDLFPLPTSPSGWLFPELVRRNFINIQSVVMRKECMLRAGLFDEDIEWIQDWWYWVQLCRDYRFGYCDIPLGRYRMHSGSTSLLHQRCYSKNRLKVFRRILQNYGEPSSPYKADILYAMGVDLCRLGKRGFGKRFFRATMALAMWDPRSIRRFCTAAFRWCLCALRS